MSRIFSNVDYVSFINKTETLATIQTITLITLANPGVITVAGHGLVDGATIELASTDSTPVLDGTHIVNVIDEDTFDVSIETTGAGTTGTLQSEFGTDLLPRHITYYYQPKLAITSISLASPAVVTTLEEHKLKSGNYAYLSLTDCTPAINGGRFVTVLSDTTFSVGVDTTGAGTANTGEVYNENFITRSYMIDSYDENNTPVYLGVLLKNQKFNLGEGRFDFSTAALIAESNHLIDILIPMEQRPTHDTRFVSINQTGHTTTLPATLGDINDSGNTNWLMPAAATTLDFVSTSPEDGAGGFTGIIGIFINGLDVNLDAVTEVIFLNGTTVVTTTNTFRAINQNFAIAGGTPGSGAVGEITGSSSTDATIWCKYLVNDTSCEVGRYTVPNLHKFNILQLLLNGGNSSDMTIRVEATPPGGFPFSLGEFYGSGGVFPTRGSSILPGGTLLKVRGFTNSGSPSTRKINISMGGVTATNVAWDSLLI